MSQGSAAFRSPDRSGTRVGGYELRRRLGAGGMGEVYRAHDARLDRDVALKILPAEFASDIARARRFQEEARAASALNHPNIVTIYDVGSAEAVSYIAMELVEGKTLRQALAAGPLPVRKSLEIACQLADGLARAHEAGIVHRDLKPENVMVTGNGLVKILDFGLAKRMPFEGDAGAEGATLTQEGTIVGTAGYMSPEQAEGRPVDFRSDQFSFGSILYEMVTGKRSFQGGSGIQTLAAIVNSEPEPIETANSKVPVPLRWVVDRCLAKAPADRYASTHDLTAELETLRDRGTELQGAAAQESHRLPGIGLIAAAAILAAAAAALLSTRRPEKPSWPDFQRLTFRRGHIGTARFAPDGRTVVYSATSIGQPGHVYTTRTDGQDSTQLALPAAELLGVSTQGELALSLDGTLARVALTGGAPRELVQQVTGADWTPDGRELAIVRAAGGKHRLEFPIGKTLFESDSEIVCPRISRRADRIAFLVVRADSNVSVETVDLAGSHAVLSKGWKRVLSLCWSADGKEVWFAANERGWRTPVYAADQKGTLRLVMRLPNWVTLNDIAPDGRALITLVAMRSTIRARTREDARERDLTWHESSFAKAITPDGKTLLFDEGGEGYFHSIYVRPTEGGPAKLLGDGRAMAISPDGRWVAANARERGSALLLLPTGAGETRILDDGRHHFEEAAFLPDSSALVAADDGSWLIDLSTGKLSAVGGAGFDCSHAVSPDGKEAACLASDGGFVCPVAGGACRPIPGFRKDTDDIFQWSADGQELYVGAHEEIPLRVERLDLATGRRAGWQQFGGEEEALYGNLYYFAMTPDAKTYAYSSFVAPGELYLVMGLK